MALRPVKKPVGESVVTSKKVASKTVSKKLKKSLPRIVKKAKKIIVPDAQKTRTLIPTEANEKNELSIRITDNTQKNVTEKVLFTAPVSAPPVLTSRAQLSLALVSPFRFPISQDQLMRGTARYVGVFSILVGVIFTFLNFPSSQGTFAFQKFFENTAQVTTATYNTAQTATAPSTATIQPTTQTVDSAPINKTPQPRIAYSANSPLTGPVTVTVTVPEASQVTLVANGKHGAPSVTLGNATHVDSTTWRFIVHTEQYPDGEYQFVFIVSNQYGTYNFTEFITFMFKNVVASQTTTVKAISATSTEGTATSTKKTNDVVTGTTTTSTPVLLSPVTSLTLASVDGETLHEKSRLTAEVNNASDVSVYARNTATMVLYYVASGVYEAGTSWKIEWDTNSVPDGMYALHAKAVVNNAILESKTILVTVHNNESLKVSTTTTSSATSTFTKPAIQISIPKATTLTGFTTVSVGGLAFSAVELYALRKNSLTPFYLGRADNKTDSSWEYLWQTQQTPNGDYELYARVETAFGFSDSDHVQVRIFNDLVTTLSESEENTIDTLRKASSELSKISDGSEDTSSSTVAASSSQKVYIEPVSTFVVSIDATSTVRASIEEFLNIYREELNKKIELLAAAVRSGDVSEVSRVKQEIEDLKNGTLLKLPPGVTEKQVVDSISTYLSQITFETAEFATNNETVLKQRIGDAVLKDSDTDGIADYDEVNLYKTNPFSADTDGDGFTDSTEVQLGQNPKDSKSLLPITHESPTDSGVTRSDILSVSSVTAIPVATQEENQTVVPQAVISGKGLPNSFVTLYIYSTPIVVTVKTDADGSWSYVFNKELENGKHEVYVAITDNAGHIVAKSNPLSFIKTAEAFSQSDAVAASVDTTTAEPSLIEGHLMFLVASIGVIALGLVLILLGLHVNGRPEEQQDISLA